MLRKIIVQLARLKTRHEHITNNIAKDGKFNTHSLAYDTYIYYNEKNTMKQLANEVTIETMSTMAVDSIALSNTIARQYRNHAFQLVNIIDNNYLDDLSFYQKMVLKKIINYFIHTYGDLPDNMPQHDSFAGCFNLWSKIAFAHGTGSANHCGN